MPSFDTHELRVCIFRCTEILPVLRFSNFDQIREQTSALLCTLLKIQSSAKYSDAPIHVLQDNDQQELQSLFRSFESALVTMKEAFTSCYVIHRLDLDQKPKKLIIAEVNTVALNLTTALRFLAVFLGELLVGPAIGNSQTWVSNMKTWKLYNDDIRSQSDSLRQLIDIFDPKSDFRQALSAKDLTKTHSREKAGHTAPLTPPVSESSSDPPAQDPERRTNFSASLTDTTIQQVFLETRQESLLRLALRETAAGKAGCISLDKEADDALREAAIKRIANSSSSSSDSASTSALQLEGPQAAMADGQDTSSEVNTKSTSPPEPILSNIECTSSSASTAPACVSALQTEGPQATMVDRQETSPGVNTDSAGHLETSLVNIDTMVPEGSAIQNGAVSKARRNDAELELVDCLVKTVDEEVSSVNAYLSNHKLSLTAKKIVNKVLQFGGTEVDKVNQAFQKIVLAIFEAACQNSGRVGRYVKLLQQMSDILSEALKTTSSAKTLDCALDPSAAKPLSIKSHMSTISPLTSCIHSTVATEASLGVPVVLSALYLHRSDSKRTITAKVIHCWADHWLTSVKDSSSLGKLDLLRLYEMMRGLGEAMEATDIPDARMESLFQRMAEVASNCESRSLERILLEDLIRLRSRQWSF